MPMSNNIFQFKITLNESAPRIWRRILVPAGYTFFDLHCAIQNAMGWTDSHLHGFRVSGNNGKDLITIQLPSPDGDDREFGDTRDERKEHIADYFDKKIKQCVYSYDFGDGWDHTVLFERALPKVSKTKYPQCVAGKNACPPEDCGGLGGYDRLREILKNPKHKEHKETLEWLCVDFPEDFDPFAFNKSEVEFENPKERLSEVEKELGISSVM